MLPLPHLHTVGGTNSKHKITTILWKLSFSSWFVCVRISQCVFFGYDDGE